MIPASFFEPLESRQLLSGGPVVTSFKVSPRSPTGTGSVKITVTYQDSDGVDATSFSNRDIRIAGPNGFARYAHVITSISNGDGSVRTVTYKFPPPNRLWNAADNGVYQFTLHGGVVSDILGNFADFKKLGSIRVNVVT